MMLSMFRRCRRRVSSELDEAICTSHPQTFVALNLEEEVVQALIGHAFIHGLQYYDGVHLLWWRLLPWPLPGRRWN